MTNKKLITNLIIISILLLFFGFLPGKANKVKSYEANKMKTLKVKWKRLIDKNNKTCKRCGSTENEIQKAIKKLKKSLAPLDITVTFEKSEIDSQAFAINPLESNRIWIGERSLEEWIDAKAGKSPCCDVCGDEECRTVEINGKTYETIPSDIIVRAGLLAASQLLNTAKDKSCCPSKVPTNSISNSCCSKGK